MLVDVVVEGHDLDAVLEDEAAGVQVLERAPEGGAAQQEGHGKGGELYEKNTRERPSQWYLRQIMCLFH